ncbi:hypothetical protein IC582_016343 [Cucumis melo]
MLRSQRSCLKAYKSLSLLLFSTHNKFFFSHTSLSLPYLFFSPNLSTFNFTNFKFTVRNHPEIWHHELGPHPMHNLWFSVKRGKISNVLLKASRIPQYIPTL